MNKYRAKSKTTEDGFFHSTKELTRWNNLKLLERAGEIRNLQRQVKFQLAAYGFPICKMILDFVYEEKQGSKWKKIYEDVKGFRPTKDWILKARLFEAQMKESIRIV